MSPGVRGGVAAVWIRGASLLESRVGDEAGGGGFGRRNDEASAVQLDAGAAKPVIRLQGQDRSKVGADGEVRLNLAVALIQLHRRRVGVQSCLMRDLSQHTLDRKSTRLNSSH